MSQHGSGATFRGCTGHNSRIDFVLLPPSTTVTHVSVCYKAGQRLQLARTLGWMDHAPIQCRFLHQSWFDDDANDDVCHLSPAEARDLSTNVEAQRVLASCASAEFAIHKEELDAAMDSRDVDRHWTLVNNIARAGVKAVRPLLRQRQKCWEDGTVIEWEDLNKDWTESGSVLLEQLQGTDDVRVCCQQPMVHLCSEGHICVAVARDEADDDAELHGVTATLDWYEMRHVFVAWHWNIVWLQYQRGLSNARSDAIIAWREKTAQRMEQADKDGESVVVWECARLLAGTKVGRRRQWRDVARPVVPGTPRMGAAFGPGGECRWTICPRFVDRTAPSCAHHVGFWRGTFSGKLPGAIRRRTATTLAGRSVHPRR